MALNGTVISGPGVIEKQKKKGFYRNTKYVIEASRPNFDAAYKAGVMGVRGRSLDQRRVCLNDGRTVTDMVRCSYLGLDNHPAIVAGAVLAVKRYQSLHWSCARTRLNFELLGELEERLSSLFRSRVIAYSTVMVANMGALPIIASGHLTGGTKPVVVFDRFCHISLAYHKPVIADETDVITIDHNDMEALERICQQYSNVVYIADGVYSMGGHAPIEDLRRLQDRYGLFLYIDDAHGISIFGQRGEGYARSQFPHDLGDKTIIAASLGKGYGASGGILMLGTEEQEDIFRRYSLPYAFSAAPNLAAVGAALASADIHESHELRTLQDLLHMRIRRFDDRIHTAQKGDPLPIRLYPLGDEQKTIEAARSMLDLGFYTSAVFFPTVPRGAAGLRICISASLSLGELNELCTHLVSMDRGLVSMV